MGTTMNANRRIGFHYFSDTQHYTKANLTKWFDEVGQSARWMCLKSSCSTAIPEVVLQFCESKGIQPIVQFNLAGWHKASAEDLISLLMYYKDHGVEFIQLDGDVNQRQTWEGIPWEGSFLNMVSSAVLEFHKLTQEFGFWHVLPNLVPGGDYWDLVVMKHILRKMHEARVNMDTVVMSFNATINGNPLLWGKGGKKKWTEPQPYQDKFNGEDHRGFLGFEWYQEVATEEFGKKLPILLLNTGEDLLACTPGEFMPRITELITFITDEKHEAIFDCVLGICFGFNECVYTKDVAALFGETTFEPESKERIVVQKTAPVAVKLLSKRKVEKCISHYLLLPLYDWGISPWHLEVALPFIRKYKPTIGYSVQEAAQASFVTILMDDDVYTQEDLEGLKSKGCKVTVIQGDGTEIANILSKQ